MEAEMNRAIRTLPELNSDNLQSVMAERIAATQNDRTVIPMLWQGLLTMELNVSGCKRTVKVYIPQDCPQGTMFVLLNIPNGEQTVSFLEKSGWFQRADQDSICLLVAEPGPGGWQTPYEEQSYFDACFQAWREGVYFRGGLSIYLVGYGEIGTCLHKIAITTPLKISAAVFVDASEMEEVFLREQETKSLDTNEEKYGISLKDVPVPVWIVSRKITAQTTAAAEYWKQANHAGNVCEDDTLGTVYTQNEDTFCTCGNNVASTAIKEAMWDPCSPSVTAVVSSFLLRYSRFGNNGPFGNTLNTSVDYESMGVEFRRFTDANGIAREYLVYVPKAYRGVEKLPLVFALHGASESIRNYFEESQWYRKAEQEGFIVAMPETPLAPMPNELLNGAIKAWRCLWQIRNPNLRDTDVAYLNEVLDQLIADYPVDTQRIYCTGHSMGCMMSHFLGSGETGQRFAALGVTSGPLDAHEQSGTERLPVFMTMGQYDLWDYKIEKDSPLTAAIDFWLVRNGLATEESVQRIRTSGAPELYSDGRWINRFWKNGTGVPLVRYSWIQGKDHMNTPEENFKIWDEWFSKWRFDEDNQRRFEQ